MIDTQDVEMERKIVNLDKDREFLAAVVACLVEERGGSVFLSADLINARMRNRAMVMEENDDPRGITIRAKAR